MRTAIALGLVVLNDIWLSVWDIKSHLKGNGVPFGWFMAIVFVESSMIEAIVNLIGQ